MYITYALFDHFISLLVSGAYLAKLTTSVGISDSMTAILSAIITLSGVFQVFSILLAHKTPVKTWVIPTIFITSILFSLLYLIPLIGLKGNLSVLFLVVIIIANALKSVVSPILSNWFLNLVSSQNRGMYSSKIVMVSIIGGTIYTLIIGALVDKMEALGKAQDAFKILMGLILVLIIGQILPLILSKEKHDVIDKKIGFFSPVRSLVRNKSYRTAVIVFALFGFASGLTTPFLGTYQINELGFSMSTIAIMDTIVNAICVAALAFFGRYSFTHSKKNIISLSYLFAILAFVLLIISTPSIALITFPAYRAVLTFYSSANCVSASNYLFEVTPPEDRTAAISISTICSGLSGFCATLIASVIFDAVQKNGFSIFGIRLYAQQVMAIISLVIIIALSVFWTIFSRKNGDSPEYLDF